MELSAASRLLPYLQPEQAAILPEALGEFSRK
jgi:hypothetical protein